MYWILVTGATGYIGSHTCILLLKSGYNIVILDNFSNSSPKVIDNIIKVSNLNSKEISKRIKVFEIDICNPNSLDNMFSSMIKSGKKINAVIHFAGLKSVAESVEKPYKYWETNVLGGINLIKTMESYNCKTFVFSSSATVYGPTSKMPIKESDLINPCSPYGSTKASFENFLVDISGCTETLKCSIPTNKEWRIARLRYFNPVGAHSSGGLGELPKGKPNNLFPLIAEVCSGEREILEIFGNDWPTKDGTGVRDYIHVMDLAEAHLLTLSKLFISNPQILTLNLGTGIGTSVLELIKTFELETGRKVPYKISERRSGDHSISIADPINALKYLNWKTKFGIKEMCRDGWRWKQSQNNI